MGDPFLSKSFKLPLHLKLCSFKGSQEGMSTLFWLWHFHYSTHITFFPIYTQAHTYTYVCTHTHTTNAHPLPDRLISGVHKRTLPHNTLWYIYTHTRTQSQIFVCVCEHLIPLNNLGQQYSLFGSAFLHLSSANLRWLSNLQAAARVPQSGPWTLSPKQPPQPVYQGMLLKVNAS